jgi:ankyrin repeat protein
LIGAAVEGRTEMIRFLISHGADINRHDHLGETPLIAAAEMGQLQAVKILLMDGADACATRFSGQTAGEVAQGRFDFTNELVYRDIAEYLSSRARCQK